MNKSINTESDFIIAIAKIRPELFSHELIAEIVDVLTSDHIRAQTTSESEDIEELSSELQRSWWAEALPTSHHLIDILGESDFFLFEADCTCPNDTVSFSGEACKDTMHVIRQLIDKSKSAALASEYITEELIESFFVNWRLNYFNKIALETI